ncbi:MAG: ParM/StbA family protein [Candidatus Methanomethylicaceae archaeon]
MTDVIGIDIGYGFTKTFMVNNGIPKMKVFPTIVSSHIPSFSFSARIPIITVNGKKFSIGEELVINGIPYENTTRRDFIGSPSYMAVLGYALLAADFHGKVMVLGLPPTFYQKDRARELSDKIREQWFVSDSGKPVILPETVRIIPQGAGIFFACAAKYPLLLNKNVLVIDLGYYTMDIVFFSSGKYVEGLALSYPMGVKRLYDDIRKEFSNLYGTLAIDDDGVEDLIIFGKYIHLEQEYKLDVTHILTSYRDMIYTAIKGHIEKVAKRIDYAFMGGGGVKHLQEEDKRIKGLNLVDDPQFANAIGFYLYGKQILGN